MKMSSVFKKLNLGKHERIVVVNAPESFERELRTLQGVRILRDPAEAVGFSLAFVTKRQEVETVGRAIAVKSRGDAIVWFAYPKGTSKKYKSEINRDHGWQVLGDCGFEAVRSIAIDEDWSAIRFRRAEFINTMKRDERYAMSRQAKRRLKKK